MGLFEYEVTSGYCGYRETLRAAGTRRCSVAEYARVYAQCETVHCHDWLEMCMYGFPGMTELAVITSWPDRVLYFVRHDF